MVEKNEHLLDYIKKPAGYMTIILLAITVISTFWITSYFQDKKELTIQEAQYNFLTRNEIDQSDVNQHIKVYYDGKEIYDPHVIKVTIKNTGNQEILENDFINDNFELFFDESAILYDASVSSASSQDVAKEITSKIEIQDNHLLINSFLLNKNEHFTISIITNQETDIFYNFRIVGISNIKKKRSIYVSKLTLFLLGACVLFAIYSLILLIKHKKRHLILLLESIAILLTLASLIISIYDTTFEMAKNMQQFIFK